jgi:hypothetical protein
MRLPVTPTYIEVLGSRVRQPSLRHLERGRSNRSRLWHLLSRSLSTGHIRQLGTDDAPTPTSLEEPAQLDRIPGA